MNAPLFTRRHFLQTAAAVAACAFAPGRAATAASPILGQGNFRYRVVPGWGVLGADTPVNDCHGLARDRAGHIILLTNHTANNVIVYDRAGRLVHKWGATFPGAHGLSLVTEGDREVLFITDLSTHRVTKSTLDGTILDEWRWPEATGKYAKEDQYKPSWTLHLPNGDFYVLDGYGRDYIVHYGAAGKFRRIFGGAEGGIVHWGPHAGMIDARAKTDPSLLIAMSDQQYLLRLSLDGKKLAQTDLPGGNPRQIRHHGAHYFVAHLGDNWPKDRASRGFLSVLDADLRVVSNIAGTAPIYDDAGKLQPMRHQEDVFIHPHDLLVDTDESIYVAQFASGKTYPIKLERI
ncbi:MAG: 6-bladed beta-propeller [Undibacterium sp.]|nr:6-bladed beta-propeller [Opitutaceae bacterium]